MGVRHGRTVCPRQRPRRGNQSRAADGRRPPGPPGALHVQYVRLVLRRVLFALVAGALLSLAYEPVAFAYVMPVALAAFALTTREVRSRAGFAIGLAFGVGFYFPHIYWMSPAIGAPAWLALATLESLFYGARRRRSPRCSSGCARGRCGSRPPGPPRRPPAASGRSAACRGAASASASSTRPLAPALAYVGVNGVSFLVAALGFLLARLVLTSRGDERLFAAAGLVGLAAVAVVPTVLPWTLATTGQTTVAAIQGNVPGRGNDVLEDPRGLTQNHVDTTVQLAERGRRRHARAARLRGLAGELHRHRPVRGLRRPTPRSSRRRRDRRADPGRRDRRRRTRSTCSTRASCGTPSPAPGERYTKRHPVGYGEYIPLPRPPRPHRAHRQGRLGAIPRDMLSRHPLEPLDDRRRRRSPTRSASTSPTTAASPPRSSNGAELLTVQTSNASFIFTDQVEQQFAITRTGPSRPAGTSWSPRPTASPASSHPTAPSSTAPQRLTRDIVEETVDLRSGRHARRRRRPGRCGWCAGADRCVGMLLALGCCRSSERRRSPSPPTDERTGDARDHAPTRGAGRRPGRDGRPDLRRGRQPRLDPRPAARRRSPRSTCSWSTTSRPTAPASSPTSSRPPTPGSTCCTAPPRAGSGRRTSHGFAWALDAGYDVIGEMDADGSHQPEQLHRLLDALPDADLVIGSRWVPGGSVVNWPLRRELLSRGGNLYVRLLLGIGVRDATAGFRLFRRADPREDRPRRGALHRLRLPDRPGRPHAARRAAGARGADRVRRAGPR